MTCKCTNPSYDSTKRCWQCGRELHWKCEQPTCECAKQADATITEKHDKKGHLMPETRGTKLRELIIAYAEARIDVRLASAQANAQINVSGHPSRMVDDLLTMASHKAYEIQTSIDEIIKELCPNG